MSTDFITYLNYFANWSGESEQHIDAVINEYNLLLKCDNLPYETSVDQVFNDIKHECQNVRDETILADTIQIAADAAAIASIWSFGMGMAVYAALQAEELIIRNHISSKATELNNMLTNADTTIADKMGETATNFVKVYKDNNALIIASSPKGLDTRTCRSYLYQFLTHLKHTYDKELNVSNFQKYAESARILYNSEEIEQIYNAVDIFNLSDKTDVDLVNYLKVLAEYRYPSPTAQKIIFNISFVIMLQKLNIAGERIKAFAEEAGVPAEELETSRFEAMDVAGKLVAAAVVIMSVIDIIFSIINIVDVVQQCEKQCDEIDNIRANYKSYFKSICDAATKMNEILKS